jgi:Flp pilus assembly protein TadG
MVQLGRMQRWIWGRMHDERGVTLILMALSMVVLLGFSALVIDLGAARQMKRQSANAADASALGGAQDLPNLAAVATQIKTLALANFSIPTSDWTAANCPSSPPAGFNEMHSVDGTPCVSYDASFNQVAVVTPTRVYNTAFARAIGTNQINIRATAVAERTTAGLGSVQPYGLYGTAGGGNGEVCLVTGPGGHAAATPPCNGPDAGNFGSLDIRQYGNDAAPTQQRCGNGQNNLRLSNNVAQGVDHVLSIYSGTEVVDFCAPGNPNPNTVEVKTGNAGSFDDGIRNGDSFDDGKPAKLRRIPAGWPGGWPTRSAAGKTLDNKPLWDFIGDPGQLSDVPDSCQRSVFTSALSAAVPIDKQTQLRGLLQTCFIDYNTGGVPGCTGLCTGVLFNRNTRTETPIDLIDIQNSTRFVYVPRFVEATPPNGNSGLVHIAGFKAVFLQRLFGGCNANSCGTDFEPGVGTSTIGANNDATDAITGFAFNPSMLPGSLGTNPFAIGETQFIQLLK